MKLSKCHQNASLLANFCPPLIKPSLVWPSWVTAPQLTFDLESLFKSHCNHITYTVHHVTQAMWLTNSTKFCQHNENGRNIQNNETNIKM